MKKKGIDYSKWGYFFIAPFFICFFIFSCIPLITTINDSFNQHFYSGLKEIGPNFIGFSNYKEIWNADLPKYILNTFILWIIGFVPQIVIALIIAAWFSDGRFKIHGEQGFKVIIYLPNLIMASAFSMLFFTLFSNAGPINEILMQTHLIKEPILFFNSTKWTRAIIAYMNFLMWFGNSSIMLMSAIMGVNPDLFEAAEIDGCNHTQIFFKITLPMIRPLLAYTLITSLIGGLQMYDVPQILTNGNGGPNRTTMTLIMLLNSHLQGKNYGMAGALSVYLAIISGILCFIVYRMMNPSDPNGTKAEAKARRKRERMMGGDRR
jgi:multiple sugar transport system permease protein